MTTKKIMTFTLLVLISSSIYAEMLKTEINGKEVEYYSPDMSKVTKIEDSKPWFRVIIEDPTPLPPDYTPIKNPLLSKTILGDSSLSAVDASTTTSFVITYIDDGGTDLNGKACSTFPEDAKTSFEAAADVWAAYVSSDVPITIQACWADLGDYTLGYSAGYVISNFSGSIPDTFYKDSLANALAGEDLRDTRFDMYLTYNETFDWYYGVDGNTPVDKHDLLTVVLHEMAHGLNFSGGMTYGSSNCGASDYGCTYNDFPGVYDRLIVDGSGNSLLDTYQNDSQALGDALRSGNLYFNGTRAKEAYNDNPVKIYAPSTWSSGSSYTHLDFDTFNDTVNELMVYAISSGEATHVPDDITLGMLYDFGWLPTDTDFTPKYSDTLYDVSANVYSYSFDSEEDVIDPTSAWTIDQGRLTSNDIDHDRSTYYAISVSDVNSYDIYFDYGISSEEGWDKLYFNSEGSETNLGSGEFVATYNANAIIATDNQLDLEWSYRKDANTDGGLDNAWIDNILITTYQSSATDSLSFTQDTTSKIVEITNNGIKDSLQISSISLSDSANFILSNGCVDPVPANDSCSLVITYKGPYNTNHTTTLSYDTNDASLPHVEKVFNVGETNSIVPIITYLLF